MLGPYSYFSFLSDLFLVLIVLRYHANRMLSFYAPGEATIQTHATDNAHPLLCALVKLVMKREGWIIKYY
jgi:hypothetical protein